MSESNVIFTFKKSAHTIKQEGNYGYFKYYPQFCNIQS